MNVEFPDENVLLAETKATIDELAHSSSSLNNDEMSACSGHLLLAALQKSEEAKGAESDPSDWSEEESLLRKLFVPSAAVLQKLWEEVEWSHGDQEQVVLTLALL